MCSTWSSNGFSAAVIASHVADFGSHKMELSDAGETRVFLAPGKLRLERCPETAVPDSKVNPRERGIFFGHFLEIPHFRHPTQQRALPCEHDVARPRTSHEHRQVSCSYSFWSVR